MKDCAFSLQNNKIIDILNKKIQENKKPIRQWCGLVKCGGDKGIRRKRPGRFRNSEECELVHFSERLRSTNRALHCAFRGHFVSDLLAMRLHSMSANATRLRLSSFVISPQGFLLQGNTTIKSWGIPCLKQKHIVLYVRSFLVEPMGFEPLTF